MARFAVIEDKTKEVINVIVYNLDSPWMAPKGHIVVQNDKVGIGDIYDEKTNTFTRPEPKE